MSQEQDATLAGTLFATLGSGASADEIASLFSIEVKFEITGHVDALPSIGYETLSEAFEDITNDSRELLARWHSQVDPTLAADGRAGIVGEFASTARPIANLARLLSRFCRPSVGEK